MSNYLHPSDPDQERSAKAVLSVVPPLGPIPSPTQLALCRPRAVGLCDVSLDRVVGRNCFAPVGDGISFGDPTPGTARFPLTPHAPHGDVRDRAVARRVDPEIAQ